MKEKVKLSGVPETMLQTVYARAKESRGRGAIHDPKAEELTRKLDYDFSLADKDTAMRSGVIEHMGIHPGGPLCYCGNHGCLETYCSANALEKNSGLPVKEFFFKLRTAENADLLQIWRSYLDNLAIAVKNFNLIIDSPVILSGYLAPYLKEEDIEYLLGQINAFNPFPISRSLLLVGTHGQYTPAIGTALSYIAEFLHSFTIQ